MSMVFNLFLPVPASPLLERINGLNHSLPEVHAVIPYVAFAVSPNLAFAVNTPPATLVFNVYPTTFTAVV